MLKTLKSKINLVYICLVLLIAAVGITSIFKLYGITKSIDGLMTNNYKSIEAVNHMMEIIQNQNRDIMNYVYSDRIKAADSFNNNTHQFYKWFSIEYNNITEVGEKEYNERINSYYLNYIKLFSRLQEDYSQNGAKSSLLLYNNKIIPLYESIKQDLMSLSDLNQGAMFNSKNEVTYSSSNALQLVFVLSIVAVLSGFLISKLFINRFFKPVTLLTETVKSVKEGNLDKKAPVLSQDEIGELALEFNNMTTRLQEFEQSTMGKLLDEKNKSLAIVKSISDPIMVLSINYKIILINSACEDIFGITEEEVINRHLLEVIRNGELYDHVASVFGENEMDYSQRIMNFKFEQQDYYFNVTAAGVRGTDSKINSAVVLFQNVTQLMQLEKMKSDLISTISHEFKTPLTSILMGISLMDNSNLGELTDSQKDIIETIKEDGEKLSSLVNNLLSLSKLESHKEVYDFMDYSIEDIILTSVRGFHSLTEEKGIKLYYEIEENIPEVRVDFEKITWVINNLVSNAFKATRNGGEISIKAFAKNQMLYVAVRDNGVGIPREFKHKIFEKFSQVENPNFEGSGSGLGLSIAKEIIDAHGGRIWCESRVNVGSTFTFTLPLKN